MRGWHNVQRPHKFHAPNPTEQVRSGSKHALVSGFQANLAVQVGDFDVVCRGEAVDFAHELGQLWGEGLRRGEELLQEDDDLVGGEALDVAGLRLEGRSWQGLPFLGELVDYVYEGGVELRLGWETRGVEPLVPVELGEELGGFGVGLEEFQDCGFEFVRVKGFALESCEVLDSVSLTSRWEER